MRQQSYEMFQLSKFPYGGSFDKGSDPDLGSCMGSLKGSIRAFMGILSFTSLTNGSTTCLCLGDHMSLISRGPIPLYYESRYGI